MNWNRPKMLKWSLRTLGCWYWLPYRTNWINARGYVERVRWGWLCFALECEPKRLRGYTGDVAPIMWNPWNKVVQSHHDGTVFREQTNRARAERGLPVPWTPEMAEIESTQAPVF